MATLSALRRDRAILSRVRAALARRRPGEDPVAVGLFAVLMQDLRAPIAEYAHSISIPRDAYKLWSEIRKFCTLTSRALVSFAER